MHVFYADQFVLPLPEGHRFPMSKYRLLRERVQAELTGLELRVPEPASDADLRRAHTAGYVDRVVGGEVEARAWRRVGFPWSPELVERSRRSVGGTLGAARRALEDGSSVNLAGGTHHAFADRGEGFCVFNDVAVATRVLQAERRLERVLVVDLDVHQGNGTASIFRDDPSVFTLSLHGARNYPFKKEESDLDVPLPDGTGDEDYLAALEAALDRALPTAGADFVFYLAGADAFVGDRLGKLSVTRAGLERRDRMLFERCRDAGLPVAVVMAGGYAPDVDETVAIHLSTVSLALKLRREVLRP